jgi:hypothetical protein
MTEVAQGRNPAFVPCIDKFSWARAQRLEDLPDGGANRRDAPECQRGREERGDLAVARVREAVCEREGVRIQPPRGPVPAEGLEALAEEGEVARAGAPEGHRLLR